MKKKVKGLIKLQLLAGKATPAPPVGPVLGQQGVNIMEFCKSFNAKTKERGDEIVPVVITVYVDRTFDFMIKRPLVSYLIRTALGLKKGGSNVKLEKVGKLTKEQLFSIARSKKEDLNAYDLDSSAKIVAGVARSMGVEVEEGCF